jgi:hypothetical protein
MPNQKEIFKPRQWQRLLAQSTAIPADTKHVAPDAV